MARQKPDTTLPDGEEPTGLTIGGPEIAAGIEEPVEQPAPPDEATTLAPDLGELIELPDGRYRVYRLERRDGNLLRNEPPEIAIMARREHR